VVSIEVAESPSLPPIGGGATAVEQQQQLWEEVSEDLLRAFCAWRHDPCDADTKQRCECPVCHEVMVRPRRIGGCQHHACAKCLEQLHTSGVSICPRCGSTGDLQEPLPAALDTIESLASLHCSCRACGTWEGLSSEFGLHLRRCEPAQGAVALRNHRFVDEARQRHRRAAETAAIDQLYADMAGASPAIVQRLPAKVIDGPENYWSSPLFAAGDRLWSLRVGPLGGSAQGARYFCILPHGHTDRLRCSFIFARRPGEGYKERRVHDWPADLAGHPWGPTVPGDELAQYKQVDGSLLMMIQAVSLGSENDPKPDEGAGSHCQSRAATGEAP